MLLTVFLSAILAANAVSAVPMVDSAMDSLAHGESLVFKRDTPLTARDIELAEINNVNLTEMYKHSVEKRDDGDHVTIWVHKTFHEDDGDGEGVSVALDKRQKVNPWSPWNKNKLSTDMAKWCGSRKYRGDTGPNAPYTGGARAIVNWATNNRGAWAYHDEGTYNMNLIVAGSNNGANIRFAAGRKYNNGNTAIGSHDVRDLTHHSLRHFQKNFSESTGGWRIRAHGSCLCFAHTVTDGRFVPFRVPFDWTFTNSAAKVH